MKPGEWKQLAWVAGPIAAGFAWLYLLVWLSGLFPALLAYGLSVTPIVLFAGVVFLREERWKRRRRRRLIDEEFRR